MSSGGGVTNVRWKKKGKGLLFVDKMSTILEDKHVRKKRGHISPEDTLRAIFSVKKWTYFFGSSCLMRRFIYEHRFISILYRFYVAHECYILFL